MDADEVGAGWHADPSGRFPQRYHDGSGWTEHVADDKGVRSTDEVGRTAASEPDGFGGGQGQAATATAVRRSAAPRVPYGTPIPAVSYAYAPRLNPRSGRSTPGLVLAVVGLALVVVAHLVEVEWLRIDELEAGFSFSDLRDVADQAGADAPVFEAYAAVGWVLALVASGFALVAALVRPVLRWPGLVVALLMASWAAVAIADLLGGDASGVSPTIGSFLAVGGLVLAGIGAALPSDRRQPPEGWVPPAERKRGGKGNSQAFGIARREVEARVGKAPRMPARPSIPKF